MALIPHNTHFTNKTQVEKINNFVQGRKVICGQFQTNPTSLYPLFLCALLSSTVLSLTLLYRLRCLDITLNSECTYLYIYLYVSTLKVKKKKLETLNYYKPVPPTIFNVKKSKSHF